jgi:hypothetical protein
MAKDSDKRKHAPRTPDQRELHRAEVVRLIRRGYTKSAIAAHLRVSPNTITEDWKVVIRQIRADQTEDLKEYIACKLQEYSEIKKEAWEQWDKSKQDARKRVRERNLRVIEPRDKKKGTPPKTGLVVTKDVSTRTGQCGDPRYLQVILNCLSAERELLGLDPVKEVTIKGKTSLWDILANGIPDTDLPDEIEQQLEQLLGPGAGAKIPDPPYATSEIIEGTVSPNESRQETDNG